MISTITPVVIPAQGGSFSYNLRTFNTVQNNLETDFWWKVIYPATNTLTLGPITISLPLDSTSFNRTQRVPGNAPAGNYQYILYAGDYPGMIWATDTIPVTKLATGDGPLVEGCWVLEAGDKISPLSRGARGDLALVTASPDPFNPVTAITYELRAASPVSLKVYDTAGRLIATLVDGWQEAGAHEITFDGSQLPSGLYFCYLQAGDFTAVRKMVMVK